MLHSQYKCDPIVQDLLKYSANLLKMPMPCLMPLSVVAFRKGEIVKMGALADISTPCDEHAFWSLPEGMLTSTRLSQLESKRTTPIPKVWGIKVLSGFLQGFGLPTENLEQAFQTTSEMAFSFGNIERLLVDWDLAQCFLTQHRMKDQIREKYGALAGAKLSQCLIVDSVIRSNVVRVHVTEVVAQNTIEMLVPQAQAEVSLKVVDGNTLVFEHPRPLTFAFSCKKQRIGRNGVFEQALKGGDDGAYVPTRSALPLEEPPPFSLPKMPPVYHATRFVASYSPALFGVYKGF